MKRNLIICVCSMLLAAIAPAAAENGDESAIPLTVVAARQQNVPENAISYLNDKLMQVVSRNGMGTADYNSRFVITASVIPVTKDIVAGPPRQFSENLDVTLYIVDNVDKKIYSSVTISAKAVETSEEKVLIKAIRSINVESPKIASFIESGRERIVAYYDSQCDNIIAKARSLASQEQYEAALFELNTIPECCAEAFERTAKAAAAIYADYADHFAADCLAKARALWMAEQNMNGARKAGEYLCKILPDTNSYAAAEKLYLEISREIKADLDFEMRVYADASDLEAAKIEAWKEIGVAYGKNQQPLDTNVTWLVK